MANYNKHRKVFAISKCETFNPLLPERFGVLYTMHYVKYLKQGGIRTPYITDKEISKELADELIEMHKMRLVFTSILGKIWETNPSLKEECERIGLTYTYNRLALVSHKN